MDPAQFKLFFNAYLQSLNSFKEPHHTKNFQVGCHFPDFQITRYSAQVAKKEDMTACNREVFSTIEAIKDLTVVFFSVSGAHMPICSQQHLAGFKERAPQLKERGIEKIICLTTAPLDSATRWNIDDGDTAHIEMWSDDNHRIANHLGLALDLTTNGRGCGIGMERTAGIIKCGVFKWLARDLPDECKNTHADAVLQYLIEKQLYLSPSKKVRFLIDD